MCDVNRVRVRFAQVQWKESPYFAARWLYMCFAKISRPHMALHAGYLPPTENSHRRVGGGMLLLDVLREAIGAHAVGPTQSK